MPTLKLFNWVIIIIAILLFNEIIVLITYAMIGADYQIFPYSLYSTYALIRYGFASSLLFALALVATLIIGAYGTFCRNKAGQLLLGLPVSFLIAGFLGNILFSLLNSTTLLLSPFIIFQRYAMRHQIEYGLWVIPIYGAALLLAVMFYYCTLILKIWSNSDKIHGHSRWANIFDLIHWRMLSKQEESLLLGAYAGFSVYSQGLESVLVLAPSGGGKSSSFAIPNILQWQGSTISNDMAFELYEKTATYCRFVKKSQVFLFAPTKEKTHCWNIFDNIIALSPEYRYGEIQRITELIIPSKSGHNSEWTKFARRLLESLIAYLIKTTGYCTLGALAEICCRPNFDDWLESEINNNDIVDEQFKANASAYIGIAATETRSGIKFNLDAYLGLYLDPLVRAATNKSDFNLKYLRRTKTDIFIGIPDGQLSRLTPLIAMFWEEASKSMTDTEPDLSLEPYPVFFNIDEYGNLPPVNQLRKNLTILRKYRVRTAIYFQYKDQAGENYSEKELKAFFNIKTKLIFTQSDIKDAHDIEQLFGMRTLKHQTRAGLFNKYGNEQAIAKPLITADQVRRLSDKLCLVAIDGKHGIKVRKKPYFRDRRLRKIKKYQVNITTDEHLPRQIPIFPSVDIEPIDNKVEKQQITDQWE